MIKSVIKRNKTIEDFDINKLSKWAYWAKVFNIDHQQLVLETVVRINSDICTTDKLHDELIKTCLYKQDEKHLLMAGKLFLGHIYKAAFNGKDSIPNFKNWYLNLIDKQVIKNLNYTDSELNHIQDYIINHKLDQNYNYTQLKQMFIKYSLQDKINNKYYESPQFSFLRLPLTIFSSEVDSNKKLKYIETLYDLLANKMTINVPTPVFSNLGTYNNGLASCCLITTNDTAESIAIRNFISDRMTCASSGIGDFLKCRSLGDGVKNNSIIHQGKIPYYKALEASIRANVQSSRGGSATTYINVTDPEIYDLIKARSVTTTAKKRISGLDFALSHNKTFRERVALNLDFPLFSYKDYPELFEAMYDSTIDFSELLKKYETTIWPNNNFKNVKYENARYILKAHLKEEIETGRAYEFNIDEVNRHTPFLDKIYQSNLCAEIVQPTKGYNSLNELYDERESGEISMCTLSAINVNRLDLEIDSTTDFFTKESIDNYFVSALYACKMVDYIIDVTDYPFPQLAYTAKARRNMGIGISGLAHLMAKLNFKYSSKEGKAFVHKLSELHAFCVYKASLTLAKEKGVCQWINKTKYPQGWLPIDTYNKNIDNFVNNKLYLDWENLRHEIIATGGLRFSSHIAHMPVESSSIASNTPNSVYPVRKLKLIKTDASKSVIFIPPDAEKLKNNYELAYDIPVKDMIIIYGVIQKFTDQAISADLWIKKNSNNKFSLDEAIDMFLFKAHVGVKTQYYTNSENNGISDDDSSCSSGACKM